MQQPPNNPKESAGCFAEQRGAGVDGRTATDNPSTPNHLSAQSWKPLCDSVDKALLFPVAMHLLRKKELSEGES